MPGFPANDGPRRVAIENVRPAVDCGRFAIKRTVGQCVAVTADVMADGHDVVRCVLLSRRQGTTEWQQHAMRDEGNDRWSGAFAVGEIGRHEYAIRGWVDAFGTWCRDLNKRIEAGQDIAIDLQIGACNSWGRRPRGRPARTRHACGTGKVCWLGALRDGVPTKPARKS